MHAGLEKLWDLRNRMVLFVGMGNVLHHDDGVGVYMAQRIQENRHIRVLMAEIGLENYIGKINSIHPDFLILIDSVFFNRPPGYSKLIPVERIADYTTNTHNISLKNIMAFVQVQTFVLGIQPAVVSFGEGLSCRVEKKANTLTAKINACFFCE
jgi:hydrogenase 3 maturation protease